MSAALDRQSKTKLRNFYLWGSRSSGKTWFMMAFCFNQYQRIRRTRGKHVRINLIWIRNKARDVTETWAMLKEGVKHHLTAEYNNKKKIRIWEEKKIIELPQGTIYLKHFNTTKQDDQKKEQFHTGDFYNKAERSILVYEEAYQIPEYVVNAVELVVSKTTTARLIKVFLFNPWSQLNWIVRKCADMLPFDSEQMKKEPFYMERIEQQDYYLRFNWKTIEKARFFHETIKQGILNAKGSKQENTIIWGDDGLEQGGHFEPYLEKIKWVDEAAIRKVFALNADFKKHHWVIGTDWAHTQDKTVFILGVFDQYWKKLILVDIRILKMKGSPKTTDEQVSYLLRLVQKWRADWAISWLWLIADNLSALNYSLDKKIQYWKMEEVIKLHFTTDKSKANMLDQVSNLINHTTQIDQSCLFVNNKGFTRKQGFWQYWQELKTVKTTTKHGRIKYDSIEDDTIDAVNNILNLSKVNSFAY